MRDQKINLLTQKYSNVNMKRLNFQEILGNITIAKALGRKMKGYNNNELKKVQAKINTLLKHLESLKVDKKKAARALKIAMNKERIRVPSHSPLKPPLVLEYKPKPIHITTGTSKTPTNLTLPKRNTISHTSTNSENIPLSELYRIKQSAKPLPKPKPRDAAPVNVNTDSFGRDKAMMQNARQNALLNDVETILEKKLEMQRRKEATKAAIQHLKTQVPKKYKKLRKGPRPMLVD